MRFSELTDEQKSKIANAKGPEEILEMVRAEGYELTDEELEAISGGSFWGGTTAIAPSAGAMTSACGNNSTMATATAAASRVFMTSSSTRARRVP